MQSRLASALQLLAAVTVSVSAKDYPTCGDCWCVPDNNGLGPCPEWEPETDFSSAVTDAYLSQVPNEILKLECNPYTEENCTTTPPQTMLDEEEAVCAFKYSSESCATYSMITYANRQEAQRDGAVLTHAGSCGVCSTTQDLALYLTEDFTTAGKICATKGLFNEQKGLECYMDIGLSLECAKIWNYDGIYDGRACGKTCMGSLTAPNNGPPPACELNECLQCDEDKAGPIFSSIGGRTRRRSGLESEIIRPCDTVARIFEHNPCPAIVQK